MSQKDAILEWLKAGNSITPLEALDKFKCLSLSQRCGQLRRAGWPINSERVTLSSGKRVAKYFLVAA